MNSDPQCYSTLSIRTGHSARSVPDPTAAEGNDIDKNQAFVRTYRMLRTRIGHLLNVPIQSVDRMSLKLRLDEIESSLAQDA